MTNVQIIDYGAQAKQEHAAWVRAKNPTVTGLQLMANLAGFSAGWREAIRTMKSHGALKVTD